MKKKCSIIWYDSLDSTNTQALKLSDSLDNMSVLSTKCQTAGRGQRGNKWHSKPEENLTFSIFLRFTVPGEDSISPNIPTHPCHPSDAESIKVSNHENLAPLYAKDQFTISQIATIAQCRFLRRQGIPSKIKWPNDIYCQNKKISGMLVENSLSTSYVRSSVIGIGLNVNQTEFSPDLPNPVSMKQLTGRDYDIETLLEDFIHIFTQTLQEFHGANTTGLKSRYEEELYRLGEEHEFTDISQADASLPANPRIGNTSQEKTFKASIKGVTQAGELILDMGDGTEKTFGFKEIAYII